MNPYLQRQRAQFEALRASIEGLQTRAADENRDLTEDELRSVTEQGEQATKLANQIESLTAIETRARAVEGLAASLGDNEQGETRLTGNAQTRDRDPGHYTRSSANSFFGDLYSSRANSDDDAQRRLVEHNRALSTGVAGAGIVPPKWLTDEMELLARQGRALASAVRNIDLGNDPRPITLPRQSTGTDAIIAQQSTENTHPTETDAWGSTVDTVVPKPFSGIQIVSRQMLEMSSPAVDQLIYGDMVAAYNSKIESAVGAALITAAGTAVTTLANEAAFTATAAQGAVVDTAMAVWSARKAPADLLVLSINRWGKFLKLLDTTGRPLIPPGTGGPMNVPGVGDVTVAGNYEGLGVIVTDGIGTGYTDSAVVLRASDTVLFESSVRRFKFEEVAGPESVKLGIWAYSAIIVRQATKSAKRFVVTAA